MLAIFGPQIQVKHFKDAVAVIQETITQALAFWTILYPLCKVTASLFELGSFTSGRIQRGITNGRQHRYNEFRVYQIIILNCGRQQRTSYIENQGKGRDNGLRRSFGR